MAITKNVGGGLSAEIDGILGLGAEATRGPSFMENLRASGKIDDSMVSFELGFYNSNSQLETPSSITFGGYDKSKFSGDLLWFPLKTNNWWALDMREFSYGTKTIAQFSFYDGAIAVIDTGTSLLGLP